MFMGIKLFQSDDDVAWHDQRSRVGHKDYLKMIKPIALHTEGTAQVSEWFNVSDTAKKLY